MVRQFYPEDLALKGFGPNRHGEFYACTMAEYVEAWRKTFGQSFITFCTDKTHPGGHVYEGVSHTSMNTSYVSKPRYMVSGCYDGRPVFQMSLSDIQWFKLGDMTFFLDNHGKHMRQGTSVAVALRNDAQPRPAKKHRRRYSRMTNA